MKGHDHMLGCVTLLSACVVILMQQTPSVNYVVKYKLLYIINYVSY